jgi:Zn-dependent protease
MGRSFTARGTSVRLDLDVILPSLLAAGIILLVSFPVHEFAHAWAAYRLGDGTAKLFGRLTLNPIVHFDPLGGFLLLVSSLIGVGIGWAKPTPVNPINLRGGRRSEGLVAAAGPLSNLVLAVFGGILFRPLFANYSGGTGIDYYLLQVVADFVVINIALLLFNFVPVAPLDGSKVLFSLMSPRTSYQWRPVLEQYGFIILLAVAFLPIFPGNQTLFGEIFQRIGYPIVNLLLGIDAF